MTKAKNYTTAKDFRRALEDRLALIAKNERIEVPQLRKQVSYDRLLARLFTESSTPWALKGGYAMQLRLPNSRATRDVDLAMRDGRILSQDPEKQGEAMGELLQKIIKIPRDDFFSFLITGPTMDLDGAPYGGARFHVEARLADRTFEKFQLDIGMGDIWIEPLDMLTSRAWLDFAGIPAQSFPAIPKEQQFAEKLHAYTRPRASINSRVKDLIDMILLIESGTLDKTRLTSITRATFERYGTHTVTKDLAPPPDRWLATFPSLAKECGITLDMPAAYKTLQDFVKTLPL